eukprot:485360-Hanusia_phi.AAC.2
MPGIKRDSLGGNNSKLRHKEKKRQEGTDGAAGDEAGGVRGGGATTLLKNSIAASLLPSCFAMMPWQHKHHLLLRHQNFTLPLPFPLLPPSPLRRPLYLDERDVREEGRQPLGDGDGRRGVLKLALLHVRLCTGRPQRCCLHVEPFAPGLHVLQEAVKAHERVLGGPGVSGEEEILSSCTENHVEQDLER